MLDGILSQLRNGTDKQNSLPFEYKKITADREIRLFRFKTRRPLESISITIEHVPIDDLPYFESISYTWGDSSVRKPIWCRGRKLEITPNLWDALLRIRARVGSTRRLWADQICINQACLPEKNKQVMLMGTIFSSCARVICWLGEEEKTTQSAVEMLKAFAAAEKDNNAQLNLAERLRSKRGIQTAESLALKEFFSRPWFRRVWTLQEVFVPMSSPPMVVCGSHELGWPKLIFAFLTICHSLESADERAALFGYNARYVASMLNTHLERNLESIRLSALVLHFAVREASNPSDVIYAMLGIARNQGFDYPRPNYNLSSADVFMRYTRAMIEQDRSLEVLTPFRRIHPNDELPSWVLTPGRLDRGMHTLYHPMAMLECLRRNRHLHAKPISDAPSSSFDRGLTLSGRRIDQVNRFLDTKTVVAGALQASVRWPKLLQFARDVTGSLRLSPSYEHTGESISSALLKTLVVNDFFTACPHPWNRYDSENQEMLLGLLRYKSRTSQHTEAGAMQTEVEAGRFDSVEWTTDYLYEFICSEFRFDSPKSSDISTAEHSQSDAELLSFLDEEVCHRYASRVSTTCAGRHLAVTRRGFIALVPGTTRVGDDICWLIGGVMLPFVLHASVESGKHELVGEAYVHGLVIDENLRRAARTRQGTGSVGDDLPALEKFCLV